MGLFQSLPEQPQDWGGLPAEPYDPQFDTARLDEAGAVSPGAVGETTGATASVTIAFTMEPAEPSAESAEPSAESGGAE